MTSVILCNYLNMEKQQHIIFLFPIWIEIILFKVYTCRNSLQVKNLQETLVVKYMYVNSQTV